jgi:two-component system, NtrC family, sensor kinase
MQASNWTRVLFEAIDDAVFVHDAEGNILEANPAACRRLGYTREELLRLNTRDIDDPEFAAGFTTRLQSQLATGGIRCEGVHRTKDGRRIDVDINTSAIHLDGKPAVLAVMRDITGRKQIEEALGKQSQLLQSILDNMSDAIVVADAQERIVLFNPMAEYVFGAGLLQSDFKLYEADQKTLLGEFPAARCVRGETFDGVELFVRHREAPDGLWISVAGRPLRERSGAIKGGVLVCNDITEHQRVEKELRDSRALYESLVQSVPQNIFRKDRQGRVTFGNERYCASLKRPLSELLGKTDFDLFPAETARKYVRDDQQVMLTGKALDTIEEHYLPDGKRLYVHVVKTPVFNAEREVIGVQGIFWDVTQETLAHEAVALSEKRYRQLTVATMDGIIVIDPDGAIVLFNPAAERMFGFAAVEVLGSPAAMLVPDAFQDLHALDIVRFLESRLGDMLVRPQEFKGKRKDGSDFPVEIALSVLTEPEDNNHNGHRPVQILAAIRDLTERNKMRAVLVQNEKLASIGLLSAGVAHEINNPLAFVANNLVVLERDCGGLLGLVELYESAGAPLNADLAGRIQAQIEAIDLAYVKANMARILSRTREGIDRVTRIVHSLRGMARTEPPRRQDARIPDLINSSLEILHGKFKRLGITVVQRHDPHPVISCVPTQISQVVLNLLVNAFQAIEASHRSDGRIEISTTRQAGMFLLEITDNGPGIKREHLPRLFDPFFTTKEVGEGTGLGLSISHHIVSAHGGRIDVDSTPGAGTCFRVFLPLNEPRAQP